MNFVYKYLTSLFNVSFVGKLIALQTLLMGFGLVVGAVSAAFMLQWMRSKVRKWSSEAKNKTDGNVIRYIRGDFLDPNSCKVEWGWKEPMEVGHAVSFRIKFYTNNGQVYPISDDDKIAVKITSRHIGADSVVPVMTFANADHSNNIDEVNVVKVSFTVTKSGSYEIIVTQNDVGIRNSPFTKSFTPGVLSPGQTLLTRTTHALLSVVTMTVEKNRRLTIDARDEFDNKCATRLSRHDLENKFDLQVKEAADLSQCPAFIWNIRSDGNGKELFLDVTMFQKGCYKALLTYDDVEVQNGDFEVLVLNSEDSDEVHDNVVKRDLNVWFECRLLNEGDFDNDDTNKDDPLEGPSARRPRIKSSSHMFVYSSFKSSFKRSKSTLSTTSQAKPRKVFCYLTPKQLIIKEYYFRIFPKRLFTFRVSPITRIVCGHDDELTGLPTFQIQDGVQNRLLLGCAKRNVLVATFIGIIYSNMGGQASTFEEKLSHFYKELRRYNKCDSSRQDSADLQIDRNDLLHSSYQATRRLSDEQWRSPFTIIFKNELGLDWGGVGREWCQVLTKALFEAKSEDSKSGGSGLFKSMKDDSQALVLPNPSSVSGFKLKYYEFAGKIVGKCLLESSAGGIHVRLVSARFARSFLAQLIGLPITYTYFGSDDRELFTTKVKYILENDVDDMSLTFSEEVYSQGELAQEINLLPNGANIAVTNDNKRRYLNRLAQYRLSESVRPEIEHFIKGLTSLVPDYLLSVFDENELELVMCGSSNLSLDDMKKHSLHTSLPDYASVWFWAVLSSFTQDDLARLLQFTTGCAQLPPEGFSALQPKFEISTADYHDKGSLPTAHTCFNRLCLPQYDSYEEMRRMLKIAITEGATGFGLA